MRIGAILAGLLLLAAGTGPSALAQAGLVAVSETGLATTFTPAPETTDFAGNKIYQGTVYEGSLTGSPMTGSFRLVENAFMPAGAGVGASEGSFVFRDAMGNSLTGTMTSQVQRGPTGSTADGQFSIQDGTGVFTNASGGGDFSVVISAPGQPPVLTFTGNVFGANLFNNNNRPGTLPNGVVVVPRVTNADRLGLDDDENVTLSGEDLDDIRSGNGFGDRNHIHIGPGASVTNQFTNLTNLNVPVPNRPNNNNDNDNGRGNNNNNGNGRGHGRGNH